MSSLATLTPRPADALLGLMAAYRADPRPDKVDLGVGVYRTDDGMTPIMQAVAKAEAILAEEGTTKIYEGPQGNPAFCAEVTDLVYGEVKTPMTAFSAPGGCGALALAMMLIKRATPDATAWVSRPTWPNHKHIAATAGLKIDSYAYAAPADPGVDFEAMRDSLAQAKPGDCVVIQGPCHNPTGIDLTAAQWVDLAETVTSRGVIPLVDIAYHGFASSLEDDIAGVRTFLDLIPEALVAYSCSKNFGLYRDRCGALLAQAATDDAVEAVRTHIADIARATYSMPPAHGPAIVATILQSAPLKATWMAELDEMRGRMMQFRADLAAALHPRSNGYDPQVLTRQTGMFSQLPFGEGGVDALREGGIYIPGSGRINIAGLTADGIPNVAEALSAHL